MRALDDFVTAQQAEYAAHRARQLGRAEGRAETLRQIARRPDLTAPVWERRPDLANLAGAIGPALAAAARSNA